MNMVNPAARAAPGAIEAQERAGQRALVSSSDMPKELRPSREAFEKLGFTFGEDVDRFFVSAALPAGWTRAATSHAMHSDILDAQGRQRVGVFYKAAPYDRRADAHLVSRFQVRSIYADEEDSGLDDGQAVYAVFDAGSECFRTEPFTRRDWPAMNAREKEAIAWLAEHVPDYDDPTANW